MLIINKFKNKILVIIIFSIISCEFCNGQDAPFVITRSKKGILIEEKGEKVLFYQEELKSLNGEYKRNNYIHPLYSLDGDTLTADFPEDHPYHRGIFWAWHNISINDTVISDPWIIEDHNCNIIDVLPYIEDFLAIIKIKALWSSPKYLNNVPYLKEETEIIVHLENDNKRIIDFRISLLALVKGIKIGGAENKRGYGGFCNRIITPDDLIFTSSKGRVTPQEFQIKAGPWMDFSGTFGSRSKVSGITLICNPNNPDYPQSWILRQKRSMQNVVYPGQRPVKVSINEPIVLNYRMIIHRGSANVKKITKWVREYK